MVVKTVEMKDSARYLKIVEWSEEGGCYVGLVPVLMYGGRHGDDELEIYAELCEIVEEVIELYREDGKPLPPPTAGRDIAGLVENLASDPTPSAL